MLYNKWLFINNVEKVLAKLQSSLKEVKQQFKWPGTVYFGERPVFVYYYNTDDHAKEVLKEVSNSLHDWIHPKLPEDLSFIKNSKPWLINTSHEKESYILTNDEEEINRIQKIKGLEIIL